MDKIFLPLLANLSEMKKGEQERLRQCVMLSLEFSELRGEYETREELDVDLPV